MRKKDMEKAISQLRDEIKRLIIEHKLYRPEEELSRYKGNHLKSIKLVTGRQIIELNKGTGYLYIGCDGKLAFKDNNNRLEWEEWRSMYCFRGWLGEIPYNVDGFYDMVFDD